MSHRYWLLQMWTLIRESDGSCCTVMVASSMWTLICDSDGPWRTDMVTPGPSYSSDHFTSSTSKIFFPSWPQKLELLRAHKLTWRRQIFMILILYFAGFLLLLWFELGETNLKSNNLQHPHKKRNFAKAYYNSVERSCPQVRPNEEIHPIEQGSWSRILPLSLQSHCSRSSSTSPTPRASWVSTGLKDSCRNFSSPGSISLQACIG